jgi:hypothetical protein
MLRLLESVRLVSIIVSVLLATLLLFAGCDSAGIESPQKTDVEQYGPLGVAYMPYGETLLSPRELESAKTGAKSAYGCYLAERGMEPDADWNVFNIYLHFPQEMVDAAGGEVQNVVHTLENKAEKSNHQIANCYIPESEGARGLLVELLELPDDASSKSANAQTSASTSSQDDPYGLFSKRECHISEYVCIRDSDTGLLRDCIYEVKCSGSIYGGGSGGGDWGANFPPNEDSGSTSPGGGTGDDPGGSDGPGCTSQHFQPVGSSCAPPDDSDDEPEPADEPVSKADLEQKYIDECGYTNSGTQDKAFEVDARYALGFDAPTRSEFSQNSPDGVKRGVIVNGAVNPGYYRAIMEAKHKESQLIGDARQTEAYLNELARPYRELPGYETQWPPYLAIVSLSNNQELRYLDDQGQTLTRASELGINVFHLTLYSDSDTGAMSLRGRTIGMVTTSRDPDGSLTQRRSTSTLTERYDFEIRCKAHEAQDN